MFIIVLLLCLGMKWVAKRQCRFYRRCVFARATHRNMNWYMMEGDHTKHYSSIKCSLVKLQVHTCEISSSHGGEYDVQSCLLGHTDTTHPWWWRQYAPLKRRSTFILHGSISQKTTLNIIQVHTICAFKNNRYSALSSCTVHKKNYFNFFCTTDFCFVFNFPCNCHTLIPLNIELQ
jgi:hypothetical protein